MAVFQSLEHLPDFHRPVLTLGTFDGVHAGHRAILEAVKEAAHATGGESMLITFEPHPRKILFPDQELKILTPLEEKVQLIREAGIEHVVVAPFTKEFSQLSASDYIREFLVRRFQPHVIVIGHDHHFGHDRKGNLDLLQEFAGPCDYTVSRIPEQLINDAAVSSTKIRKALLAGNVAEAGLMLGRPYSLKGRVVHGKRLGATIGFPTANLEPLCADQLLPESGVYAVLATVQGRQWGGMMNIGTRPTVTNEKSIHLEVHLFDFSAGIYGEVVAVSFIERLRSEQKFASVEALVAQLKSDETAAKNILRAAGAIS